MTRYGAHVEHGGDQRRQSADGGSQERLDHVEVDAGACDERPGEGVGDRGAVTANPFVRGGTRRDAEKGKGNGKGRGG